jgi:hypothetical protein
MDFLPIEVKFLIFDNFDNVLDMYNYALSSKSNFEKIRNYLVFQIQKHSKTKIQDNVDLIKLLDIFECQKFIVKNEETDIFDKTTITYHNKHDDTILHRTFGPAKTEYYDFLGQTIILIYWIYENDYINNFGPSCILYNTKTITLSWQPKLPYYLPYFHCKKYIKINLKNPKEIIASSKLKHLASSAFKYINQVPIMQKLQ